MGLVQKYVLSFWHRLFNPHSDMRYSYILHDWWSEYMSVRFNHPWLAHNLLWCQIRVTASGLMLQGCHLRSRPSLHRLFTSSCLPERRGNVNLVQPYAVYTQCILNHSPVHLQYRWTVCSLQPLRWPDIICRGHFLLWLLSTKLSVYFT